MEFAAMITDESGQESGPPSGTFMCPCCGYPDLSSPPYEHLTEGKLIRSLNPPYSAHFGMPSYEVCACCGFEFGNDDDPGTAAPSSFEEYLYEWSAEGMRSFDPLRLPMNWSLEEQLTAANKPAS